MPLCLEILSAEFVEDHGPEAHRFFVNLLSVNVPHNSNTRKHPVAFDVPHTVPVLQSSGIDHAIGCRGKTIKLQIKKPGLLYVPCDNSPKNGTRADHIPSGTQGPDAQCAQSTRMEKTALPT